RMAAGHIFPLLIWGSSVTVTDKKQRKKPHTEEKLVPLLQLVAFLLRTTMAICSIDFGKPVDQADENGLVNGALWKFQETDLFRL
ncbi:transducin family protein, partial [Corchorus capsularis]